MLCNLDLLEKCLTPLLSIQTSQGLFIGMDIFVFLGHSLLGGDFYFIFFSVPNEKNEQQKGTPHIIGIGHCLSWGHKVPHDEHKAHCGRSECRQVYGSVIAVFLEW